MATRNARIRAELRAVELTLSVRRDDVRRAELVRLATDPVRMYAVGGAR